MNWPVTRLSAPQRAALERLDLPPADQASRSDVKLAQSIAASQPHDQIPRPRFVNLMRHRSYLRVLTSAQRRVWWEQRKRLTPRVQIGSAWLPQQLRRSFVYAQRI